eukprot:SAG31_NODE_872_length_11329_cov_3.968655_13_plen_228_part_00
MTAGKQRVPVGLGLLRQAAQVLPGLLIAHFAYLLCRRAAREVGDQLDLLVHRMPREQWLSTKQLSTDAPCGPDVDGRRVAGEVRANQLGRTVPPGCNVVGPEDRVLAHIAKVCPGQPKVANLEVTIGVDEDVARLQVAVEDVRIVDVAQPCEQLVQQPLNVHLLVLGLRADQVRKVGVQQLEHDVDGIEVLALRREQHVVDGDDVRVLEQPQESQLPNDAHSVGLVR